MDRRFKTRLTEASKELPDFAGHYRFANWGCGSTCETGAIIDLRNGKVYWDNRLFCPSMLEGADYEYRIDSRLMIIHCGQNFDEHLKNWPDLDCLVWRGNGFGRLLHIPSKQR